MGSDRVEEATERSDTDVTALLDRARVAIAVLKELNADLEPELLPRPAAQRLLESVARGRRLADFALASLARRDPGNDEEMRQL